jgi:hypothetical protein
MDKRTTRAAEKALAALKKENGAGHVSTCAREPRPHRYER